MAGARSADVDAARPRLYWLRFSTIMPFWCLVKRGVEPVEWRNLASQAEHAELKSVLGKGCPMRKFLTRLWPKAIKEG